MLCFEIVCQVLEEIYAEIPGKSESEKDQRIREALKSMSTAYADTKIVNAVNHADIVSRLAYIYKYVTSHANLVYQVINRTPVLQELFDKDDVQIACFGGGPGSELLGVLKYMEASGKSPYVMCQLFDKERAWSECWSDVGRKVSATLRFHSAFDAIDIFNHNEWHHRRKFLSSDLFVMTFFLSEIFWNKEMAEPFFDYVFSEAKSGSLFLYIDNNDEEDEFHGWFDAMTRTARLQTVYAIERFEQIDDTAEEKRDLGRFWDKFGLENSPKLRANIAIRVLRKT